MALLEIKNLTVKVKDRTILNNLSLSVPEGGIHVLMGPNGSGKSTLCGVLMGHPSYEITGGDILFDGADISSLKTDERARKGIFLSFQHPKEIPGVSLSQITRSAINSGLKENGLKNSSTPKEFITNLKEKLKYHGLPEDFLRRPLNEHASGGEKKRLEMVQLAMLKPRLAILDEIDSGLDIDAMKSIAQSIKDAVTEYKTTFIVITHYQRLLQYIEPDSVHIIVDGKIVKSGDHALAHELERDGYKNFIA